MKLICTQCGADGEMACECGVAFIALANATPKAAQVAEALKDPANVRKSDRVLAAELGVTDMTVGRARKATATNVAVEKRVGKDGKARKAPAKPKLALVSPARFNAGALDIGTERIPRQPVQLMPAQLQRLKDCAVRVDITAGRVAQFAKLDFELFQEDVANMLAHKPGGHKHDRDFAKDARKALAWIEGDVESAIDALVKLRELVKEKTAA
jgi:hypothetical protein